jgi:hypothetical protein
MSEEKKYTPQEAAIAVLEKAKELLEKSELMKSSNDFEERQKRRTDENERIKGVHPSTREKGKSFAGAFAGGITGTTNTAKYMHNKKLQELKDMPNPKLPKSEMVKSAGIGETRETGHEKGVHTSAKVPKEFQSGKKPEEIHGKSAIGEFTGKRSPKETQGFWKPQVHGEHKKVLGELKDMPKPNLPKSEGMAKAEVGKHGVAKPGEKGVHQPPSELAIEMNTRRDAGKSVAGFHNAMGNGQNGSQWKENAKELHTKKLQELKDMPKPSLPKSEIMDKKESGYEKGVHRQVHPQFGKQGQSQAGAQTEAMHNKPKATNIKEIKEQVAGRHKEVLGQMKDIKPNLPKSEKMGKAEIKEDQPEKSDKAFEVEGKGKQSSDDSRLNEQVAPDMNPKEEKEGNNKEWGTMPETYGTLKLAKFIGHMEAKRKMRQGTK